MTQPFIWHILPVNRMLIKPGMRRDVLDLLERYQFQERTGRGTYSEGEYIDHLYLEKGHHITFPEYKEWLNELVPCLDMYHSTIRNFCFAEFQVSAYISEGISKPTYSEVVVYTSPVTDKFESESLKYPNKIRKIQPSNQLRVTMEDYQAMKRSGLSALLITPQQLSV